MQIIINITEHNKSVIDRYVDGHGYSYKDLTRTTVIESLAQAVHKGIVLPKEHGRLIDADAFIAMMEDASKTQKYKELLIGDCLTVDDVFKAVIESLLNKGFAEGDAPTIIEADRSEDK
jgi:hypothetical protein